VFTIFVSICLLKRDHQLTDRNTNFIVNVCIPFPDPWSYSYCHIISCYWYSYSILYSLFNFISTYSVFDVHIDIELLNFMLFNFILIFILIMILIWDLL